MAGGTDGNIISYDASGDPVAIATGSDGQVLTSTGAGSPPAFEAAAGGGLIFIASADPSNAASADFDDVFTTTYKRYLLLGTSVNPHTTAYIAIRTANAGGSYDSGASDYSWVADGPGHGGQVIRDLDFADSYIVIGGNSASTQPTPSDIYSNGFELWIDNPMDSGGRIMMRWNHCANGAGEFGAIHGTGARLDTAAQDSIQVLATTGNISGHFVLYGLVDS